VRTRVMGCGLFFKNICKKQENTRKKHQKQDNGWYKTMKSDFLARIMAQLGDRDREIEAKKIGCERGLYEWYSLNHPFAWCDHLQDEEGLIEGQSLDIWMRQHEKECFHPLRHAKLPLCSARCRDGHACRARVVVREDGCLAKRCRLHGGLSTGAKTAAGRAAIIASNKRRAQERCDTQSGANERL